MPLGAEIFAFKGLSIFLSILIFAMHNKCLICALNQVVDILRSADDSIRAIYIAFRRIIGVYMP